VAQRFSAAKTATPPPTTLVIPNRAEGPVRNLLFLPPLRHRRRSVLTNNANVLKKRCARFRKDTMRFAGFPKSPADKENTNALYDQNS
jgi:hypothetical protein